jgi:hypothetical protein
MVFSSFSLMSRKYMMMERQAKFTKRMWASGPEKKSMMTEKLDRKCITRWRTCHPHYQLPPG